MTMLIYELDYLFLNLYIGVYGLINESKPGTKS